MSDTTNVPGAPTGASQPAPAGTVQGVPAPLNAVSQTVPTAPPAAAPTAPAQAPQSPAYVNPYARPGAVSAPAVKPPSPVSPAPAGRTGSPAPQGPDVTALAAQVEALRGVVRAQADDALSGVPENVAATVRHLAGDDPAAQLATLRTLRANELVIAPAAIPQGATTMPAVAPAPPATTTPVTGDASVLAEHERLSRLSPIIAANFYRSNVDAIVRARSASRN